MMRGWRFFAASATLLLLALGGLAQLPAGPRPTLPQRTGLPIRSVKAWGYQLQRARPELIPAAIDLLVIDLAPDASEQQQFTAEEIAAFRRRPGAPDRIVLAYMSIGEAEIYRSYWRSSWVSGLLAPLLRPPWLARENADWKGNYLVRYWMPGWQKLIVAPRRTQLEAVQQDTLGGDLPYLDKIIEAGFDGVYLDRVDSFAAWEKDVPNAKTAMRAFVTDISTYAKTRRPGFLVVPQNGEELTRDAAYLKAIDGIAREELVYGLDGGEHENSNEEITFAADVLARVARAGKPVFVVEYVSDPDKQQIATRLLTKRRFVPTFTARELNVPPTLPPDLTPVFVPPPIIDRASPPAAAARP